MAGASMHLWLSDNDSPEESSTVSEQAQAEQLSCATRSAGNTRRAQSHGHM